MVGSLAAYWLGVWGGRPAIDRWGRYLLLRPHEVDRAHAWFERRGEAVVFLGRLVPLIRAFVSLPAGIAKMDLGKFTLFTFLGVLPWCLALAAAGKALGSKWSTLEQYFLPVSASPSRWSLVAALPGGSPNGRRRGPRRAGNIWTERAKRAREAFPERRGPRLDAGGRPYRFATIVQ